VSLIAMFESYKDIFNQRGAAYHQAMMRYPLARIEEFQQIIKLAELQDGHMIFDIPSGGCYINNFIDRTVKIISVETSKEFIKDVQSPENNTVLVCDSIADIPLLQESADRIISLAGLHHVSDKPAFYQEVYRLLKKGGLFCIADAFQDAKVAQFLDIFVDQNNSMGHQGEYLNAQTLQELAAANFQVVYNSSIQYSWRFDSPQEMAEYCQLLFGIDRADPPQIIAGIDTYLGYQMQGEKCYMNWELHFLKCIK
jgi:SAM-dependent methyltransferase